MKKRLVAALATILFVLLLFPVSNAAGGGQITIVLEYETDDDGAMPLVGVSVGMYYVADIAYDAGGARSFTLVGDFVDSEADLDIGDDGGKHREQANLLEEFVKSNEYEPIETKKTDASGRVVFEGLDDGWYFFVHESGGVTQSDGRRYIVSPVLAPLPDMGSATPWDIVALPKKEPVPENPPPIIPDKQTSIIIYGEKAIAGFAGLQIPDKEFTFHAVQVDRLGAIEYTGDGAPLSGSGKIKGAGTFAIEVKGLELAGSPYAFLVTEDQAGDGEGGWSYSKNYYWVGVNVVDAGGEMLVASISSRLNGEGAVDVLRFSNTFGITVSCEVDKDTIRRTSAAYVSLPGYEGFDNVGDPDEMFRYDINFRSTSNVDADEFVVDDPLENVRANQVRVEYLWTPIVWGDVDGLFNLWYRTNLTDDGTVYSLATANPEVKNPTYPNTGFKLWSANMSTTSRIRLSVADLGLAAGEYITALRFEYGAVKVGFTSMNYEKTSQNGEHRSTSHGPIFLRANNTDVFQDAPPPMPAGTINCIFGDFIDWTPVSSRPDYAADAALAAGLQPVSFLVSAARPMYEEDIINSAISRIALGDQRDWDQDAVVTRLISTFGNEFPDFVLPTGTQEMSFIDNAVSLGWNVRSGGSLEEFDFFDMDIPLGNLEISDPEIPTTFRGGSIPQTGDTSQMRLWVVLMAASAAAIVLLVVARKRQEY